MLIDLYWLIRSQITTSRVVAFLTPVLAAAAGWLATEAAKLNLNLDEGQLTAIFIAAMAVVVATALKWLDGRAKYEQRLDQFLHDENAQVRHLPSDEMRIRPPSR